MCTTLDDGSSRVCCVEEKRRLGRRERGYDHGGGKGCGLGVRGVMEGHWVVRVGGAGAEVV